MASAEVWDLVLMDVQMTLLDGLAAASALRVSQPRLPIIAMTANAFTEDAAASLEAGMNAHITKPVSPLTLYKAFLAHLC